MPKHIIEDEELSMTAKIIYAEIACFDVCYKSNEKLGSRYGLKANTISLIIKKLLKKGYVENIGFDGRKRQLKAKYDKPNQRQTLKKIKGRLLKKSKADFEKNQTIDNSIENNLDNNKNNYIATLKVAWKDIKSIMDIFYKINPTLNWKNKTTLKATADMIKKFGLERTIKMAEAVVAIQGKPYAPVATTPYQMKEKLAQFKIYFDRQKNEVKGGVAIK
ncbi:MAG TPA: helix-turn-helix domain-containing protein [Candidatus Moranbacteria bacterium]|nr:helix-turn-helix domain-containing protein [Candidatus Moranbacteria bacterium]